MPAYFHKATGKRVTADEATYDGKRLRDGYNWMLEEGETARFSIDMIDGAATSRRSVFLTDTTGDAAKKAVRDASRLADATGTAVLTPAIVAASQQRDAARQQHVDSLDHAGKATRDAVRDAHFR